VDRGLTAVLVAAALGFAMVLLGGVTGIRLVVIESGSMSPTLRPADLIVTRSEPATSIHKGQVVTFRHPLLHQMVTHRVIGVRTDGGWENVTTKGDANTVAETWRVSVSGSVGHLLGRIPAGGVLVRLLRERLLWILAALLCCGGLGYALLRRIWAVPAP
jgi:signal peptidase